MPGSQDAGEDMVAVVDHDGWPVQGDVPCALGPWQAPSQLEEILCRHLHKTTFTPPLNGCPSALFYLFSDPPKGRPPFYCFTQFGPRHHACPISDILFLSHFLINTPDSLVLAAVGFAYETPWNPNPKLCLSVNAVTGRLGLKHCLLNWTHTP